MTTDRFRDDGPLAKGGMAAVHRVHEPNLLRSLAMKILSPDRAKDAAEVERFVEEAQVTAQLEHPYIPAVHELGTLPDGRHFFTMKLVDGKTLDQLLAAPSTARRGDELFSLLQIFIKVCEAVAFAHSRGVVHCDLKPQNIMVGTHGQVYVMDWGIARLPIDRPDAKAPENAVRVSRTTPRVEEKGKILGTLGYLSPEQARAKHAQIDERSDVFALGALLYRLIVGTEIYPTSPADEALARAMFAEVTPPEKIIDGRVLPKRLLGIAMKALAVKKEERFESVDGLRAEVENFVRGVGRHPLRTFAKGELILKEGDPGHSAFIVSKGRVEAYKMIHGRRQPLLEMGPGEIFGEAAIFTDKGRTANVAALEDTVAIEVSRESIEDELATTVVMGDLVRVLARRFTELDARANTLRERVDDWALHATVMTHFALSGAPHGDSARTATWSALKQVLLDHLAVPEDRAVEWACSVNGVSVDEAGDKVILTAKREAGSSPVPRTPTLPEFQVAVPAPSVGGSAVKTE